MTAWLDNRNVGVKLMANVIVTLLGLLIIATVALTGLRAQMWHDRERQVRLVVAMAEAMAYTIDGQVRDGQKTRQAGRTELLALLQGSKYDSNKYFVAYQDDGTVIVHGGDPKVVGGLIPTRI